MSSTAFRSLRLIVAEDEPLFRNLLVGGLNSFDDVDVAAEFASGEDAVAAVSREHFDVAVLDIHLAGQVNGVAAGVQIRRSSPSTAVVLLSSHVEPTILASLPPDVLGGWAYLLKSSVADLDTVARAIRSAAAGNMVVDPQLAGRTADPVTPVGRLTPRQQEVARLVAQGSTNRAIAEQLHLTEKSVENHLSRIYMALGIDTADPGSHSRVQVTLAVVNSVMI